MKSAYEFAYAWRWTQATHAVLPSEAMSQIRPLERAPYPEGLGGSMERLAEPQFESVVTASADVARENGTAWLQSLSVSPTQLVIVAWDDTLAVETTWAIFVRYWDDFCYPTSDDVMVFPAHGEWVLLYHHWEEFEWGRARRA